MTSNTSNSGSNSSNSSSSNNINTSSNNVNGSNCSVNNEIQAQFELCVELRRFINIDLFQRG